MKKNRSRKMVLPKKLIKSQPDECFTYVAAQFISLVGTKTSVDGDRL
jgi:hypothetical protein